MLYFGSLSQASHQNLPEMQWTRTKGGTLSQLQSVRLHLAHPHYASGRVMGAHV